MKKKSKSRRQFIRSAAAGFGLSLAGPATSLHQAISAPLTSLISPKDQDQPENSQRQGSIAPSGNRVGSIGLDTSHSTAFARSEEHTTEPQSLMRISYAVLCWKKQTNPEQNPT